MRKRARELKRGDRVCVEMWVTVLDVNTYKDDSLREWTVVRYVPDEGAETQAWDANERVMMMKGNR